MKPRLFVYGLLRDGRELAALLAGATALGANFLQGFDLYDLGNYPGAVPGPGTITGELYELPNVAALNVLDRAERVFDTPPLYRRQVVCVGGRLAWMYVYARDLGDAPVVASGDWLRR